MIIGDKTDPMYRAFTEGESCARLAVPFTQNPYKMQPRLRDEWQRGHTSWREKQE
jgi:hypothetical protein